MGVGIAVPLQKYDLVDVDITRIADTKKLPKIPPPFFIAKILQNIWDSMKLLMKNLGIYKPPFNLWGESLSKMNQMVSVRLRDKIEGKTFCVGTYHMPCQFKFPALMMIHCSLSAKHLAAFSKTDPVRGYFSLLATLFNVHIL
jgi:hypothetical protein